MGVISRAVMEAREQLLGPPFCMLVVAEQQQAVAIEPMPVKQPPPPHVEGTPWSVPQMVVESGFSDSTIRRILEGRPGIFRQGKRTRKVGRKKIQGKITCKVPDKEAQKIFAELKERKRERY
jgi:hypothetical protein